MMSFFNRKHCKNTHKLILVITNLDKLHPLDAPGADGDHGEADGGANNAVSPRDGQFEKGGNQLPDGRPWETDAQISDIFQAFHRLFSFPPTLSHTKCCSGKPLIHAVN